MKEKINVLFITHFPISHIGGVERHHQFLIRNLKFLNKKIVIKTISEADIKQPHIKIIGLLYIWYWLFKNRKIINTADIIHIHDVFIWYLPFRFLFPFKKVFITFHGWEGKFPLPMWNILNKRLANFLCNGSIAVGKFVEKYYGVKSNYIIYGAVQNINKTKYLKIKNSLVCFGHQNINLSNKFKITYLTNTKNPEEYLKTAEYCVPKGYLSYLESKNMGCKILTFADNPLKEDYWKEIIALKSIPTWSEVAKIYIKLWGI